MKSGLRKLWHLHLLLFLLLVANWGCAFTEKRRALNYRDPIMYKLDMPESSSLQGEAALKRTVPDPITGSLWNPNSGSLFQDIKAHRVGDIVTIVISEETSASNKADTEFGRQSARSGEAKFLGFKLGSDVKAKPMETSYEGQFSRDFKGSGTTSKESSMTAYMSARIIHILPGGNLVIRGSRWTKVNNEMQQIVLEGIIRPVDITRNNTVLSQNIADAKIFFVGKGPISRHQRPGWLGQLVDILSPF